MVCGVLGKGGRGGEEETYRLPFLLDDGDGSGTTAGSVDIGWSPAEVITADPAWAASLVALSTKPGFTR